MQFFFARIIFLIESRIASCDSDQPFLKNIVRISPHKYMAAAKKAAKKAAPKKKVAAKKAAPKKKAAAKKRA